MWVLISPGIKIYDIYILLYILLLLVVPFFLSFLLFRLQVFWLFAFIRMYNGIGKSFSRAYFFLCSKRRQNTSHTHTHNDKAKISEEKRREKKTTWIAIKWNEREERKRKKKKKFIYVCNDDGDDEEKMDNIKYGGTLSIYKYENNEFK